MGEEKVGEYVRTNEGYIAKMKHYGINKGINGKSCLFDNQIRDISVSVYDQDNFLFDDELDKYIVKHSPNIIDLIEDKDIVILEYYVSKYRKRIQRIFEIEILGNDICFFNHRCSFLYNKEKQKFMDGKGFNPKIKAIATKEQFESIEYKL